jgi:hypothetical protein
MVRQPCTLLLGTVRHNRAAPLASSTSTAQSGTGVSPASRRRSALLSRQTKPDRVAGSAESGTPVASMPAVWNGVCVRLAGLITPGGGLPAPPVGVVASTVSVRTAAPPARAWFRRAVVTPGVTVTGTSMATQPPVGSVALPSTSLPARPL